MSAAPAIVAQGLTKRFQSFTAVDHLDLRIDNFQTNQKVLIPHYVLATISSKIRWTFYGWKLRRHH